MSLKNYPKLLLQILLYFRFIIMAFMLDLIDLNVDQCAIPPALHKAPEEAFFPVEESSFVEISIQEIRKRAPEQLLVSIFVF